MLTELRISNFAVIDRLNLEFSRGLHVLTGETGAGKSIIVDAIAQLVGERASTDQIRAQADEAVLEAAFSVPHSGPLIHKLRENGLLGADESDLIIRRIVSRSGRNRLYLNGSLTPLHTLQSLAGTLVDIHGQHEQQSLMSAQTQLDTLDAYGHLRELREGYTQAYHQWQTVQRELDRVTQLAVEKRQKQELLHFQFRELEEAKLQPGEEASLTAERRRLAHAHRLGELAEQAYDLVYGADSAVLSSLGRVQNCLKELGSIDPDTQAWSSLGDDAMVQLRDLAQQLRDYRESLDQDPARLASIEERLEKLHRLRAKYGGSEASLLNRAQELQEQLQELEQSETRVNESRQLASQAYTQVAALAVELSEHRTRAAREMESRVKDELSALRMDHTGFQIHVRTDESESALGPTGRDRVEYMLSANPGEPLQPLHRVASGGELSRVMLAMKTVLAEADQVPVLIFDEVDAGVGGAVAAVMGRRLRALGTYHQVFCITHLPQIAAEADAHIVVEKEVVKKRTVVRARSLDQAGRQEEIARMLGGLAVTKTVRATAAEMIGKAGRQASLSE